ncbi:putative glutamine amidotransferase [Verrucomicrobium sp. GAS474]|uniref:gamma-glutamyl-gamma-aminobutyrate hydrolase family protein n=1 Tax=Verrucomicrobium sp. GAS474 TaxID=1882831 RepID=UPI00087980AA|nr:gamma-glutamyl-gamma-aminobutyrate hydrolase family protein [Verrucomicrobium sp. GAS474]SDT88955.1 putative glutamine amidotransferase [Verrucomicrobium sp. GAS474]
MKMIATWLRECDEAPFARVFEAYSGVTLQDARPLSGGEIPLLPSDGLLLTGGSDIAAAFLRQPVADPLHVEEPDPARDAWEFEAVKRALAGRVPILAICRGHQVLNVALGGTLHLDIPGHRDPEQKLGNLQPLRYVADASVPVPVAIRFPFVNSSHHQSIDRLGAGLSVEARHADDGTVEQVRLIDHPFALGVQYHPERDPLYRPLFDAFVEAVKANAKTVPV